MYVPLKYAYFVHIFIFRLVHYEFYLLVWTGIVFVDALLLALSGSGGMPVLGSILAGFSNFLRKLLTWLFLVSVRLSTFDVGDVDVG